MLIVILSTNEMEESTNEVMDWLNALGADFARLNGEEIPEEPFSLMLGAHGPEGYLHVDGRRVPFEEVQSIWYRRGGKIHIPELPEIEDEELRATVRRHLRGEMNAARKGLYHMLRHAHWLSVPETSAPHKLDLLIKARECGFSVPRTLITNHRDEVLRFREEVGEVIVKCLGDVELFNKGELAFGPYTEILETDHIASLPECCFPLLVQECIEKIWEIRAFYLAGECYAMAIFSQNDPQTRIDFRRYNFKKPSRMVPYRLPAELASKVVTLMNRLELETGSLDLIRAVDGRTYFLEVNPVGQFGMVSKPCNYHLEKRVAEYLMEKDAS